MAEQSKHTRCANCGHVPEECMCLPAGRTCGDCTRYIGCKRLFGCKFDATVCDWHPVQFRLIAAKRQEVA